jgi:hypothetical protein
MASASASSMVATEQMQRPVDDQVRRMVGQRISASSDSRRQVS